MMNVFPYAQKKYKKNISFSLEIDSIFLLSLNFQTCPLTDQEDYQIILKENSKTSKIRSNKPEDCSTQQIACIQESSAKRFNQGVKSGF